jgi:Spy/CpxP family protein refolding chaperone
LQISLQHSKQYKPTGNWSSILAYAVLLVVIISIPNFAVAHEECHEKGFNNFKEPPAGMMAHPSLPPDGISGEQQPFPLAGLDLTETQRDKIFQIMHSIAPVIYENEKVIHRTMESIHQLTTSDPFDATKAKLIADEHGKAVADLFFIHTETQAKVWGTLTDKQRKHLTEIIKQHDPKQYIYS